MAKKLPECSGAHDVTARIRQIKVIAPNLGWIIVKSITARTLRRMKIVLNMPKAHSRPNVLA